MIFNFFSVSNAKYDKIAFDFKFDSINQGETVDLGDYKDKVLLIVNVASRCGYTNQYSDLQNLHEKYNKDGLVVIGIPSNNFKQEPGSKEDIKTFCETNFGVSFPMTDKTNVVGSDAHPFFIWAKKNHGLSAIPKWNFHKIIVGKNGKILDTFSSFTSPTSKKITKIIEQEIKS